MQGACLRSFGAAAGAQSTANTDGGASQGGKPSSPAASQAGLKDSSATGGRAGGTSREAFKARRRASLRAFITCCALVHDFDLH